MSDTIIENPLSGLLNLYKKTTGREVAVAESLGQEGSSRRYWRLHDAEGHSLIGCHGTDAKENEAFVYLADILNRAGVNVPKVLAVEGLEYLQTDLGSVSLYDMIAGEGCDSPVVWDNIETSMRELAKVHWFASDMVNFDKCFPRASMDARSVMWDLNYFKYCFLKPLGVAFDEDELQNDFDSLCSQLCTVGQNVLMLRDFQSRNIMIDSRVPWIIDFQGARRGSAAYDVASFAWQARAGFSPEMRMRIVDSYICQASAYDGFDEDAFRRSYPLYVLMRLLQVLGAYGFRGLIERKSKFITPLPKAVGLVKELLDAVSLPQMPYLTHLLLHVCGMPQVQIAEERKRLIVEVSSFSYKKGVPVDNSGNGGGFVFDCRGVHNPGRYERYKPLTGLDQPVIEFLESIPEMSEFLAHVYSLVDHSVERYLERGFTHLCAHFGCTGGRHRSVYSAQHLAQHLSDKYGVEVHLFHREQGITRLFPER